MLSGHFCAFQELFCIAGRGLLTDRFWVQTDARCCEVVRCEPDTPAPSRERKFTFISRQFISRQFKFKRELLGVHPAALIMITSWIVLRAADKPIVASLHRAVRAEYVFDGSSSTFL